MKLHKKYTILFGFISIISVVINQQILAQNYTYAPFYDRILDYCLSSIEKILTHHNPIKDLVSANLIPSHFSSMTCTDVSIEAQANLNSVNQSQSQRAENKK
jgi:hypothetical protein